MSEDDRQKAKQNLISGFNKFKSSAQAGLQKAAQAATNVGSSPRSPAGREEEAVHQPSTKHLDTDKQGKGEKDNNRTSRRDPAERERDSTDHTRERGPTTPPEARVTKPKEQNDRGGDDLILEQLASLSTDLANARMAQAELEGRLKELDLEADTARQEASLAKQQAAEAEARAVEAEEKLTKFKEQLVFQHVQQGQAELKQLRENKTELEKRVSELTISNATLSKDLKSTQSQLQECDEERRAKREEVDRLSVQLAKVSEELEGVTQKAAADAITAQDIIRAGEDRERRAREQFELDVAAAHTTHAAALTSLQDQLVAMEGERNNYKKKAEGVAKDLKKILNHQDDKIAKEKKLAEDNTKLKTELERKSRGLKDALEALDMYMNNQPAASPTAAAGGSAHLSEDEKDIVLNDLRMANQALTKRVLELEEAAGGRLLSRLVRKPSASPSR